MIKILLILVVTGASLGQEYEFMDNLVDFEDVPYQSLSFPYPYQEDRLNRVINIQNRPNKETVKANNEFELVELPAKLKETKQHIKTSLPSIDTSFISTLCKGASKLFAVAKAALNLLVINVPALVLGGIIMVLFCKITSICTKIGSIKSISEVQKEFNSFVTPERLDMATEFIQEAIRRYRSIQSN